MQNLKDIDSNSLFHSFLFHFSLIILLSGGIADEKIFA
jgi:hypothetical protein